MYSHDLEIFCVELNCFLVYYNAHHRKFFLWLQKNNDGKVFISVACFPASSHFFHRLGEAILCRRNACDWRIINKHIYWTQLVINQTCTFVFTPKLCQCLSIICMHTNWMCSTLIRRSFCQSTLKIERKQFYWIIAIDVYLSIVCIYVLLPHTDTHDNSLVCAHRKKFPCLSLTVTTWCLKHFYYNFCWKKSVNFVNFS